MIKVLQYGLGIALILLGIVGLFLPILQGILFILLGFLVLRAHNLSDATRKLKHHMMHVHKLHKKNQM